MSSLGSIQNSLVLSASVYCTEKPRHHQKWRALIGLAHQKHAEGRKRVGYILPRHSKRATK